MALAEADGLLRGLLVTLERRGLSSNPVSFVLGSPQRPYGKPRVSLPRRSYTNVSSRNESANLKWWRSEMETPPAGACGNVERGVAGGGTSLVCTAVMGRGPSAARLRSVASSCRAYTSRSGRAQSRRLARVAGTAGRAHSRVVARVDGTVVAPRGENSGGNVMTLRISVQNPPAPRSFHLCMRGIAIPDQFCMRCERERMQRGVTTVWSKFLKIPQKCRLETRRVAHCSRSSKVCRRASCTSHQGADRSQMRDDGSMKDSLDLLAIVCAQHAQVPSMPIIVVAPCPLRMHERDDADEQPIQHPEESARRSAWLPLPLRTEASLARIRNRARRGRVLPPTPSAAASGLLADDGGWLIADVDVATGHIEWRSTTSID